MDNLQQEAAFVARLQEAGNRGGHHNRVAHQNVGVRLTHAALAPRDGHHLDGAVEGGKVKTDAGVAIGPNRDGTGEVGNQFLCRRWRLQTRIGASVTARADGALGPVEPVDQTAIDVTDADPQLALAEVVVLRVG